MPCLCFPSLLGFVAVLYIVMFILLSGSPQDQVLIKWLLNLHRAFPQMFSQHRCCSFLSFGQHYFWFHRVTASSFIFVLPRWCRASEQTTARCRQEVHGWLDASARLSTKQFLNVYCASRFQSTTSVIINHSSLWQLFVLLVSICWQ